MSPYMDMRISRTTAMALNGAIVQFRGATVKLPSKSVMFDDHGIENDDLIDFKVCLITEGYVTISKMCCFS